ncbi:MAG TPA: hypothetical protein VK530_19710 [Candidatus Acidoferrum sp.]|nr:hypothetical protein [Candidatus Acidoferrum sp.]
MADFIPKNWPAYRAWLFNLKTEIATIGPAIGLTAPQVTAVQTSCQTQIDLIDALTAAEAAFNMAKFQARTGKAGTDTSLREAIRQWKVATGWTEAMAATLAVLSGSTEFDPDTYKPEFTVKVIGGEIRIDWIRKGVQAVHIYCRLRGTTGWTKLALDTNSPYVDGAPLAQPGVPETREYMLRGVMDDQEIGLDSDIQSVTWGGN